MEKRLVHHHNMIGHEINESLECYANDVFDREVYCRKEHVIKEPLEKDCMGCPFFAGVEQGNGHECAWEDVTDVEYVVKHEERYREYERVDKLIKQGIIESVDNDLIANVKCFPYDEEKWIYEQSLDRKNRFLLGTRGSKTLICCGVNPSYASPEHLDPTMKRVESFAEAGGYDSYVMINLYPMRATNPQDMHKEMNEGIVKCNLEYIKSLLSAGDCDIWAAWGNLISTRTYLKKCLEQIVEVADLHNCKWCIYGDTTKDGHPRHPLYLSSKCTRNNFDIHEYLRKVK